VAFKKLKEYYALGYLNIYHLLKKVYKKILKDNILGKKGNGCHGTDLAHCYDSVLL
jgi:hypothetical protein